MFNKLNEFMDKINKIYSMLKDLNVKIDSHCSVILEDAYVSNTPVFVREREYKIAFNQLFGTLPYDTTRLLAFMTNIDRIINGGVKGSFAELGVWEGHSAKILHYFSEKIIEIYICLIRLRG